MRENPPQLGLLPRIEVEGLGEYGDAMVEGTRDRRVGRRVRLDRESRASGSGLDNQDRDHDGTQPGSISAHLFRIALMIRRTVRHF
jgi:hypothetical protein